MPAAAVFFADGFEEIEGLSPVDYLRRAGIDVITVGVKGVCQKINGQDKIIVTSSHNIPIITDISFEEYLSTYSSNLPDCIVCPGGSKGADNLAANAELLSHIQKVWDSKKYVAAICASPAVVLGKTDVLKGKTWTCYPGMETEAKAEYVPNYTNKTFVTDGNLITARGPGASEEFAMELVRILAGEAVYNKIHAGAQQR